MRRRLVRLVGLVVVLPVAARAAETLADRLEERDGPTVPSRVLRQASTLADRRSLTGRRR